MTIQAPAGCCDAKYVNDPVIYPAVIQNSLTVGGALLAVPTIDSLAPGANRGHFAHLAAGAMLGGFLFELLNYLVNRGGGYLRWPSTAMAIFLGILLDGIPEAFVIGANVLVTCGISLSLVAGSLLANLPEALSSAAGMKEQGMRVGKIL